MVGGWGKRAGYILVPASSFSPIFFLRPPTAFCSLRATERARSTPPYTETSTSTTGRHDEASIVSRHPQPLHDSKISGQGYSIDHPRALPRAPSSNNLFHPLPESLFLALQRTAFQLSQLLNFILLRRPQRSPSLIADAPFFESRSTI